MKLRSTLAIAAIFVAAACGGSSPTEAPLATPTPAPATPTPPSATPTPAAATPTPAAATPTPAVAGVTCVGSGGTAVAIADFSFGPSNATTGVGGSVTWTNSDRTAHTVTFDDGPNCGRLGSGGKESATFSAPGTYAYHCAIHNDMIGSVVVQ